MPYSVVRSGTVNYFVVNREPIGSVPSIALEQSDKLKKEHNQRIKAYKETSKGVLRKKEVRFSQTQAKEKERKSKLKRESEGCQAVEKDC